MKLFRDAAQYLEVIEAERPLIDRLERHLGSLNISAGMIDDDKRAPCFGWFVVPEDESKVLVMNGYNWGPGSGPRSTLTECLNSLAAELDRCRAVIVGKPGLHGGHVPRPKNLPVGAKFL